jgi:hypothetical protein
LFTIQRAKPTNSTVAINRTTPKKLRSDVGQAIEALLSIKDEASATRRLVHRLLSLSSRDVEIIEIGETQLCLCEAGNPRSRFRIHPQGMEIDKATGLLYITAVEILEHRDPIRRYWGAGRAHLFECNIQGETVRSVYLRSENENEYHPSGMVLIDGVMFIALSQYGPETSATIIQFDVKQWTYKRLFCIPDHVGLVVPNLDEDELFLGTWGSRHYYCTDLKGLIKDKRPTPSFDKLEHQDAQLIMAKIDCPGNFDQESFSPRQETLVLATGVTAKGMEHFGLDIIDVKNWCLKSSLRWPSIKHLTKGGWPPFANPTYLWVDSFDRIFALATPDDQKPDNDTTLLLYTINTASDV